MSTQADLNLYPWQFILYYCNVANADPTVYATDLSNVCTISYNASDNLVISGWLIGGYGAPSTPTLLTYPLATVLAAYSNFYTIPANIALAQPYSITTAALAGIRADASMVGYMVYDTTVKATKTWNGTIWATFAQTFLPLAGGTMTGALNMGGQAVSNASIVQQASPSGLCIWSPDSVSVSFTAATPKVVDITNFSQAVNPQSDFSFNSATGRATYTGSSTRYFRVSITYSTTKLIPITTQTLTTFISKNGSTSISGMRSTETFISLGIATSDNHTVSDTIRLATNDTIQLGASYTATTSVTFANVSYNITQV